MDVLCDTLMVEEILLRLPPKCVVRLRAASRRNNALTRRPDFAARYWQRAGVYVQLIEQLNEAPLRFLTAPGDDTARPVSVADLASFLPSPSAAEKELMLLAGDDPDGIVAVHAAGGLLLCCWGRVHTVRYYVCNPVTGQCVALPEPPCSHRNYNECRCALLTVATGGTGDDGHGTPKRFQVVILNSPTGMDDDDMLLELSVFSSDTGHWEARHLRQPPAVYDYYDFYMPPVLGQSGTSYWIQDSDDRAIAYNSSSGNNSVQAIALPRRIVDGKRNRCIGERHGWGLRYAQSNASLFEVWESDIIGGEWMLVHQVSIDELMEQNPEAAALPRHPRTRDGPLKPVGFHPTNEDVVFVALLGAMFAYSIEYGTMKLRCIHESHDDDDDSSVTPLDAFQYVHPPYPVQIPAIKNSTPASRRKGGSTGSHVKRGTERRKRGRDQTVIMSFPNPGQPDHLSPGQGRSKRAWKPTWKIQEHMRSHR